MPDAVVGIRVRGQQDLAQINNLLTQYQAHITGVRDSHGRLNVSLKMSDQHVAQFTQHVRQLIPELDKLDAAQKRNFYSLSATMEVFGKFYLVGQFYNAIITGAREAANALKEVNFQAARAVSPLGDTRGNRLFLEGKLIQGSIMGGLPNKEVGESMYQLSTFIKDTNDLTRAFDDNIKLITGTLGDARDTTRLTIQLYQQFGDSMDKTLSPGEKMHRITELMAGAMKDANSEMNELASGLKYLGPIATAVNMPLQDVVASVVALSSVGHVGRMAGTEVAAMLTNIVNNYNSEYGGVVKNGKIYRFDRKFKKGQDGRDQFDVEGTVASIVDTARSLPTAQASEYLKAIGGSMNAVRALGAFGPQSLDMLRRSIENSTASIKGQRKELEALKKTMDDTFQNKALQFWNAVLGQGAIVLDDIVRKFGFIDTFMEKYKNIAMSNAIDRERTGKYLQEATTASPERQTAMMAGHLGRVRLWYEMMMQSGMTRNAYEGKYGKGVIDVSVPSLSAIFSGAKGLPYEWQGTPSKYATTIAESVYNYLRGEGVVKEDVGLFGLNTSYEVNADTLLNTLPNKLNSRMQSQIAQSRVRASAKPRTPRPIKNPIGATPEDIARKAEEAKRKRIDYLRRQIAEIEAYGADIEHKRGYNAIIELAGMRPRYIGLVRELATLEGDTATLGKVNRATTRLDMQLESLRQQRADDANKLSQENYQQMFENDPFDPELDAMATKADETAQARARAKFDIAGAEAYAPGVGSNSRLRQLLERRRAMTDARTNPYRGFSPIGIRVPQQYVDEFNERTRTERMRQLDEAYNSAIFSSEMGAPLPGLNVRADAAQRFTIAGRMAATSERINGLTQLRMQTLGMDDASVQARQQITSEVKTLQQELERLKRTLEELNAEEGIRKFYERLDQGDEFVATKKFNLSLGSGRRYGETPRNYQLRQIAELGQLADIEGINEAMLRQELTGVDLSDERKKELDARLLSASRTFQSATVRFKDAVTDFKNAERDAISGTVKGMLQGGILDIIHGRGNPMDVVGGIANGIVDQYILRAIDPTLDAFAGAVADNVLALERNTAALLGEPMPGTSPSAGGASAGKSGNRTGGGKMPTDLMLGVGAYGILQNGMQAGPVAGALNGILGAGAMTGWNPLAMGVGGAIGLIGGLFKKKPKQTPQEIAAERNPGFYNTPADFTYEAYRWRATGGQDPMSLALANKYKPISETAPVVNVYLDGVRTTVRTEIQAQVAPGTRSNTNVYFDYHRP